MNEALYSEVIELLLEDPAAESEKPDKLSARAMALVDAACQGEAKLNDLLAGLTVGEPALRVDKRPRPKPPGIYLQWIKVAGFRGIGPEAKLELRPGPGLTLVVGRNGSGKSTFADALELVLTGRCLRLESRTAELRAGWRNLHQSAKAEIHALVLVEDGAPVGLTQTWKPGAEFDAGTVSIRRGSERLDDIEALGWREELQVYRPFLSYSDLTLLVERPSQLFDALRAILGMADLSQALDRVSAAESTRDAERKAVRAAHGRITTRLESLEAIDDRAKTCLRLLKTKNATKWKLDELAKIVIGGEGQGLADQLRALEATVGPDPERVRTASGDLREAMALRDGLAGSSEAMNAKLASILREAIPFHQDHAGTCPVCERELDAGWSVRAEQRLAEATELARAVRAAEKAVDAAQQLVRRIVIPPPRFALAELELPTEAGELWAKWAELPIARDVPDHLDRHTGPLLEAIDRLKVAVAARLEALDAQWLPMASQIAEWLPRATQVAADWTLLDDLKAAEGWMKEAEDVIQVRRFAPLDQRARELWNMLRQQSNVSLDKVMLAGRANRRHVELDVKVDGMAGVALGVMSQGELNSLALSLFLPRMTLPESPFHFMVIDDPVQAMDPHKVEGLARVLEEVAKTRQVIIFTHDTRLQEAVRRLKIDATVLEVQRQTDSRVSVVSNDDAVARYLSDARVVARYEQDLGKKIVRRAVPGHCRGAIEAVCLETINRRRLGRGDSHAELRAEIESTRTTIELMAMAMFDDRTDGAKVFPELARKVGKLGADALRVCKEGVHGNFEGDPFELIDGTRNVTQYLRGLS